MALPRMTAGRSIGPNRCCPVRLTRGKHGPSRVHDTYRVEEPGRDSNGLWRIRLTDPARQEKAAGVHLRQGSGGRVEIYDLRVEEPHRGRRLSYRLMAEAARRARELGGETLWLEAEPEGDMATEDLVSLYRKMGFRETRVNGQTGRQEMEAPLPVLRQNLAGKLA